MRVRKVIKTKFKTYCATWWPIYTINKLFFLLLIDIGAKNSEKKFKWKDCNKSFKDKNRLSRHEKNHMNEKSEFPEVLSDDQEDDFKEEMVNCDLADFEDSYRFEFMETKL